MPHSELSWVGHIRHAIFRDSDDLALNWEVTGWRKLAGRVLSGRVAADSRVVRLLYGSAEVSLLLPTTSAHSPKEGG
jgi:hypothetical protein